MGFLNGPVNWLSGVNAGVAPQADMRSARGDAMLQLGATLLAAAQNGPVGQRGQILAAGLPKVASSYRDTLAGEKKIHREDLLFGQSQTDYKENATSRTRFKHLLKTNPAALGMDEDTAKMFAELPVGDAIDAYKTFLAEQQKAALKGADNKYDFAPTQDASGRLVGVKGDKAYYLDPITKQPTGEAPMPNTAGGIPQPNVPTKSSVAGDTRTEENTADEGQMHRNNTEGAFDTLGVMVRARNHSKDMTDADFGQIQGANKDTWTGAMYRGAANLLPGNISNLAGTDFKKQDRLRSIMADAATSLAKQKMNGQGQISDSERGLIADVTGGLSAVDKESFEGIIHEQMVAASQVIINNIQNGAYSVEEAKRRAASVGLSLEEVMVLADEAMSDVPDTTVEKPGASTAPAVGVMKPKGDGTFIWSPK